MKLRFLEKKYEGEDVWSFYFKPLESLAWSAGQSIRLELPRPTYGIDERRFTIASAPHEKVLMITTRKSPSNFKQVLFRLGEGTIINAYNVEGSFMWGKEKNHRLLIAAGVGITPYRSMVLEQVFARKQLDATLIHISRTEAPLFQKTFEELTHRDPSFKYFTLSKRLILATNSTLPSAWLSSHVYISGPSNMVEEISNYFLQKGLPETKLHRDLFTGYFE